jgi:hypothetical protein
MTATAAPAWPALPFNEWQDSAETLHMWTQIVGKVRLAQSPWLNHSWSVTLYLTPRGMTTGTIPHGHQAFSIDFDFIDHKLLFRASNGGAVDLPLHSQDTADFYAAAMGSLEELGLPVTINTFPNEVEEPIAFPEDRTHKTYDPAAVNRFWRVLSQVDRVFSAFRSEFQGKASPSHFFWGSFDLAVTRFSGRTAPDHPGGLPNMPLWVAQEAYSQEVSSAGFWPGNAQFPEPIFYSYAYPTPEGFSEQPVAPAEAIWSPDLGEFVLPYEAVRTAADPDQALTAFLNTTFDAAAKTAEWDLEPYGRRHFP